MDFEFLIITKEAGIATVILNRPEALNALNAKLIAEIIAAMAELDKDENVKVVILKGAGRAFCAGVDLKGHEMGDALGESAYGPWQAIEDLSQPVIAAVHGYAITGGYLLATACDLVIASEEAKFADTHAKWGLIPAGGETQRLPRIVGIKRAKRMMMTSEMITAQEAERFGMINEVVPREKLDEAVRELAEKVLQNSQRSLKAIKWLINRGIEVDFSAGLRIEQVASKWGRVNLEPDEEREQRMRAFQEKRMRAT